VKRYAFVLLLVLAACGEAPHDLVDPAVVETPVVVVPQLPDTLPEDLLLPHEAAARRSGSGDRLYNYVCLDPPEDLQNTTPDDGRAVWFEDAGGPTIERIALYADESQAAEAMSDLRAELALCGHNVDHVGNPHEFRMLPQPDLPHAHETLQWRTASSDPPEAFVTVARLGAIVFVADHRTEADLEQDDDLWREVVRAEKLVGSFALELCERGYGRGCQDDPS